MHKDFFYLGTITKPFGFKGQLSIYLDTDQPEKYQTLDAVFIDWDGELIPHRIKELRWRGGNQAVLTLEDLSPEEAKSLIRRDLYLPLSMLPPLSGNQFYFHEVIGFAVVDQEKGRLGPLTGFIDFSQQAIMQIDCQGTEILLPAVNEFIRRVDREAKTLYIEAPEGLIDIYLKA